MQACNEQGSPQLSLCMYMYIWYVYIYTCMYILPVECDCHNVMSMCMRAMTSLVSRLHPNQERSD